MHIKSGGTMNHIYEFLHHTPSVKVAVATISTNMKVILGNELFNRIYQIGDIQKQLPLCSELYHKIKASAHSVGSGIFKEAKLDPRTWTYSLYWVQDTMMQDWCCHVLLTDVSEYQLAADSHIEQERLAMVGTMAAETANIVLNPLAVIKGSLQLLQQTMPKLLEPHPQQEGAMERYIRLAEDQIETINRNIRRFLVFGKPFDLDMKCFGLSDFIQTYIPIAQKRAMQHGVSLTCEYPNKDCRFLIHAPSLTQIMNELIQNAIESGSENAKVRVVIQVLDHSVRFTIIDTGCGIPTGHIEKIKSIFYTTKEGALGIGLTLSEILVGKMSGTLSIDSSPQGTQVSVTMPILCEEPTSE